MQKDPKLQTCDPLVLVEACEKAANDGLLLDGRQAALVVFNDRNRGPIAQYMPMYQGLMFRAYRSGLIDSWNVHVVYENELKVDPELGRPRFLHQIDGVERIIHTPMYADLGKPVLVYSAVKLRGANSMNYDVMTIARMVEIAKSNRKNVDQQRQPDRPVGRAAQAGDGEEDRDPPPLQIPAQRCAPVEHAQPHGRGRGRAAGSRGVMTLRKPRPARKRNGEAAKRLTPPSSRREPVEQDTDEPEPEGTRSRSRRSCSDGDEHALHREQ